MGRYAQEPNEEEKEKKRVTLVNETIPFTFEKLDNCAKAGKGYLVNGKLTFADIYMIALLDGLNFVLKYNVFEKYPNLQKVRDNVRSVPAIKAWIEKRPKSDF